MKDYLIIANNARRRIRVDNDHNDISKKNKITNKSRYTKTIYNDNCVSIYSRTIITIAKLVIAIFALVISSLINVQNSKKSNCFIYHKHEHLARDYPNKKNRTTIIKELQLGSKSKENYNSSLEN